LKKVIILTLLICLTGVSAFAAEIQQLILNEDMLDYLSRVPFEIIGYTNLETDEFTPLTKEIIYIVQPGDSLYKIAMKYNITIEAIQERNNLNSNMLYIGQILIIPTLEQANDYVVYYVQSGDSLYKIAMKYNITIQAIKTANNLNTNTLLIGQRLYLPLPDKETDQYEEPDDSSKPEIKVYYVKSGDSLYLIAHRYFTTISAIKEINNLQSDYLYIGQKLYIPVPEVDFDFLLTYYVERYDNLTRIARKFNIKEEEIRLVNNLQNDALYIGQKLSIPISVPDEDLRREFIINEDEYNLLTRAVHSEARGEPFIGQVAVAAVILNRVQHDLFPDTVRGVIFQPWQFSSVDDGQFWLEPGQMAYLASRAALKGWDPTKGAIYYYNPDTAESEWVFYRNVIIKIGDHYFAV
jgi:LysM repeat protein